MLKEMRLNKNMSQAQLAMLANISLRTLQEYEQGRKDIRNAKVLTVLKLSQILDCDIKDILNL